MDLNNSKSGQKNGYSTILYGDGHKAHFRPHFSSLVIGHVDDHDKDSKLGTEIFGHQGLEIHEWPWEQFFLPFSRQVGGRVQKEGSQ